MDSVNVNDGFWQNVGVCFYNLGHYESAVEAIEKVQDSPKKTTYIAWCQEAMGHGN